MVPSFKKKSLPMKNIPDGFKKITGISNRQISPPTQLRTTDAGFNR
jgi:hypothetical protein